MSIFSILGSDTEFFLRSEKERSSELEFKLQKESDRITKKRPINELKSNFLTLNTSHKKKKKTKKRIVTKHINKSQNAFPTEPGLGNRKRIVFERDELQKQEKRLQKEEKEQEQEREQEQEKEKEIENEIEIENEMEIEGTQKNQKQSNLEVLFKILNEPEKVNKTNINEPFNKCVSRMYWVCGVCNAIKIDLEVIMYLIKMGSDCNLSDTNEDGYTVFQKYIKGINEITEEIEEILLYLFQKGNADLFQTNVKKKNAFYYLTKKRNCSKIILEMLLNFLDRQCKKYVKVLSQYDLYDFALLKKPKIEILTNNNLDYFPLLIFTLLKRGEYKILYQILVEFNEIDQTNYLLTSHCRNGGELINISKINEKTTLMNSLHILCLMGSGNFNGYDDDVNYYNNFNAFSEGGQLINNILKSKCIEKIIVHKKVDPNCKMIFDLTPLHCLCLQDNPSIELILFLIENGADVNSVDIFKSTPLHWHCNQTAPDIGIVELLIKNGANINSKNKNNETALHLLCDRNNPNYRTIKFMIENGVNINQMGKEKTTAFHCLCDQVNNPPFEIVKLMIENGANMNLQDETGETSIHSLFLKIKPSYKIIKYLINQGANINVQSTVTKYSPLHYLCNNQALKLKHEQYRFNNSSTDEDDYLISNRISKKLINLLILNKIDLNSQDINLDTPFHFLCNQENPSYKIVKIFLENNDSLNIPGYYQQTPLHWLCYQDDLNHDIIELFLRTNVNIHLLNQDNKSILHYLCENSNNPSKRIIELLIHKGIDINTQDVNLDTSLHFLCNKENHSFELIELLVNNGANINTQGYYQHTPLHWVCSQTKPNIGIIELFIKMGAEINIKNENNDTPLHLICQKINDFNENNDVLSNNVTPPNNNSSSSSSSNNNNVYNKDDKNKIRKEYKKIINQNFFQIIKLLLKNNADLGLKNNNNQTPFHILCKCKNPRFKMIYFITQQGVNFNSLDIKLQTPLFLLIKNSHNLKNNKKLEKLYLLIKLFIDKGTAITLQNSSKLTIFHLIYISINKYNQNIFSKIFLLLINKLENDNKNNNQVFYYSIFHYMINRFNTLPIEKYSILKMLIHSGIDLNKKYKDNKNNTFVHTYLKKKYPPSVTLIEFFINNGFDVNLTNDKLQTPLHIIAQKFLLNHQNIKKSNYIALITLFFKYGAKINLQNIKGQTIFHEICLNNKNLLYYKEFIQVLMYFNKIYFLDITNHLNQTPLHLLCLTNPMPIKIIDVFVENNANLNIQDKNLETPLHLLCYTGNSPKLIQDFIQKGANINIINKNKLSPLFILCINNPILDVIELFVDMGADVNVVNGHSQTIMDILQPKKKIHEKIINYLRRNGAKKYHQLQNNFVFNNFL
ncbi:molting protein mlt-4 [Anaeramoeba flamelloides]|uniref:Molting protein mlt-4 n=1 Tax=Anaeramoeba flamelloides TaxID=1746091 RepID=A0ABQ8YLM0_9EUKA|nr:molting protein mlt-4 [Anaeramoeba flamelloides]